MPFLPPQLIYPLYSPVSHNSHSVFPYPAFTVFCTLFSLFILIVAILFTSFPHLPCITHSTRFRKRDSHLSDVGSSTRRPSHRGFTDRGGVDLQNFTTTLLYHSGIPYPRPVTLILELRIAIEYINLRFRIGFRKCDGSLVNV